MSKPTVLITGPVQTRSGYGSHCRDLVRSLVAIDKYDVKILGVPWGNTPMNALDNTNPNDEVITSRIVTTPMKEQPDVHIHVVIPTEFQPVGKYNIGITAGIEVTACSKNWIDGMNRMDMNIVPSKFAHDVFVNTIYNEKDNRTNQIIGARKVTKPIEILFEGADTNIFKKTKDISKELKTELAEIKENFIFLYVGHWLQGELGQDRKDTGMLVKTFFETFKNKKIKPALLLKTNGATPSVMDRNDIFDKIVSIRKSVDSDDLPSVYILHGDLTDVEMNELYNYPKIKVHVSFTKGEGFGRPLLEASLSGKPIIASNWSGHLDFLTKDTAVLLPGSLNNVSKTAFPKELYVKGSQWYTVNYQYASKVLTDMYTNHSKYTLSAKKLEKVNKSIFSLDAMTKKFETILDKYIPAMPKEISIQLPKLKKKNDTVGVPKIKLPKLKKV